MACVKLPALTWVLLSRSVCPVTQQRGQFTGRSENDSKERYRQCKTLQLEPQAVWVTVVTRLSKPRHCTVQLAQILLSLKFQCNNSCLYAG